MVIYLFALTALVNLLLEIINKHSKLIYFISFILIFIIMGGNNMNADYYGGMYLFNSQNYLDSAELGYKVLAQTALAAGIDYQMFRQIIFAVCLIAISIVVSTYTKSIHLFVFLFMTTTMLMDTIQIRQFTAFTLITVALVMHSRGNRIRFIICVIAGSLLQITTIAYLPLLFLSTEKSLSRRFMYVYYGIIIFICFIVFMGGNKIPFLAEFAGQFIGADKMIYFHSSGRLGFLIYFLFQAVCIYLINVCRRYIDNSGVEGRAKSLANSVYLLIFYSSFAMPLVMLNNNFNRFFKFGLMGLYICLCITKDILSSKSVDNKKKHINIIGHYSVDVHLYMACILLFVVIYTVILQSFPDAEEVLNNNIYFQ